MDDLDFNGFSDGGAFDNVRYSAANTKAGAFDYMSSAMQTGLALGQNYVSRRLDIDLQNRLAGTQPSAATRRTNQTFVADHADVTTRAVASVSGYRFGDMLPFLAIGIGAWFLFGKR